MSEADANVAGWIAAHAASRGDRRALVDPDRMLTFRALRERLARCAAALAATAPGAAIPVELVHAFEHHGLVLKQGYGQTKTSILCCLEARDAVRKAGSVGRPVHHAELRVVRPSGIDGPTEAWEDVDCGEKGEIVVRGPSTMLGYWQRPEETADTLRGEWLRTHDLAAVDDEGFKREAGTVLSTQLAMRSLRRLPTFSAWSAMWPTQLIS